MNMDKQLSLWKDVESFGDVYQSSTAGSWGELFPLMWNYTLTLIVAVQVWTTPRNKEVFPFPHILTEFTLISDADPHNTELDKMKSQSSFSLHFPNG